MDDDTATRFVSSLVKSIQALCNGYIDFSSSIEVIGHIHLNIDRNLKLDYVLTEEVNKSISEGATVFASHSYHSHPPPSLTKTSNENSGRNKKSQQQKDTDTHGSLPTEVPNAGRSVNRFGDSGDSSNSGRSEFDPASVKQEKRSSCQVRDSFERRRRPAPSSHTPSPAAKRSRNNDTSSSAEVIEIKEEFDDEPAVYFGNVAGGGDIQTPDFSNVVMESLDRVSQAEGGSLVPPDGSQQSPFPVMLHSNMPSTSGSVPGQSDPRASTSGGVIEEESDCEAVDDLQDMPDLEDPLEDEKHDESNSTHHPSRTTKRKSAETSDKRQRSSIASSSASISGTAAKSRGVLKNKRKFCDQCGKYFKPHSLIAHQKTKHMSGYRWKHTCHICDRTFRHKADLESHINVHEANKPYMCEQCSKCFSCAKSLKKHVKIKHVEGVDAKNRVKAGQVNERKYVCHICDKSFSKATALEGHINLHEGAKPFVCSVCSDAYSSRISLRRHIRKWHLTPQQF